MGLNYLVAPGENGTIRRKDIRRNANDLVVNMTKEITLANPMAKNVLDMFAPRNNLPTNPNSTNDAPFIL